MVRITFSGAWPAENRVQALRAVQRTLLDALHLQTDPAYYRIETEPAQARGIAVHVALFPAGSTPLGRKVKTQGTRPPALAALTAAPMTSRWPMWTPSKNPRATAEEYPRGAARSWVTIKPSNSFFEAGAWPPPMIQKRPGKLKLRGRHFPRPQPAGANSLMIKSSWVAGSTRARPRNRPLPPPS